MTELLKTRREGRVSWLTLNRPEARNALSPDLVLELIAAVRAANADPQVKCIVIQGEGEHFCAGGDLKNFTEVMSLSPGERQDLFERRVLAGDRLPMAVLDSSKPVVAVARGAVAGAGMGLCLAADYVLCASDAYFVAAHVNIGVSVDCLLSTLLVNSIGIKRAMKAALLGERIDADQALQCGMVSEVVATDNLPEALQKLAERLAAGPSVAMAGTKQLLNDVAYGDVSRPILLEAKWLGRSAASNDFAAGVEAVRARKRPRFE